MHAPLAPSQLPCLGLSACLQVIADLKPQTWARARAGLAAVVEVAPCVMENALEDPATLAPAQWRALLEEVTGLRPIREMAAPVSTQSLLDALARRIPATAPGPLAARRRRDPSVQLARWRLQGLRLLVQGSFAGNPRKAAGACGLGVVFFESILDGHVLLDAQLARRMEGSLQLPRRWLDQQGPIPVEVADVWRQASARARSVTHGRGLGGQRRPPGRLTSDPREAWGVHRPAANDAAS